MITRKKHNPKGKAWMMTGILLALIGINTNLGARQEKAIYPPFELPELINFEEIPISVPDITCVIPPLEPSPFRLQTENFQPEWAFTTEQLQALNKVGYQWGKELVTKGDMESDTDGFHDIYGWAKPFEIIRSPETGIRELIWENKESKGWNYRRIFWSSPEPFQVGDFYLVRFSYYDNLVNEEKQGGGGAWLKSQSISEGNLDEQQSASVSGSMPYNHKYILFKINELNSRFPNRFNLHMDHPIAPNGIRLAYWSARKLVTGDSDLDGISDAEEILVMGVDPKGDLPPAVEDHAEHECCGGEDLHKEDHEKAGPKPSDPDDNGLVDYKLEWQKESTRLAEIKASIEKEKLRQQQVEQERLKLEKETEQIDLELAKVGKDLSDCMAMGKKLDQELESRRKVLAGLVATLATLEGEKSSLAAQVGEKGREVLEKTAEYESLEKEYEPVAMKLAVPHLKGWHYEAEHGWLYVETGSYPYVFSQRMDAWLYYHQGTHQPWEYFDYLSQSWIDWR